MKLLTIDTAKMRKSRQYGFISAVLNLQPAVTLYSRNRKRKLVTCPNAGKCALTCLANTGRMRFNNSARMRKTRLFFNHPERFFRYLQDDINACLRKASREGLQLTVRLNGCSDISWENYELIDIGTDGIYRTVFDAFPRVRFIDYTKDEQRALNHSRWPIANYTLVYSHNEKSNPAVEQTLLQRGMNVVVVFRDTLPSKYTINGVKYPVIDGDDSDLRQNDVRGVIVGLRYKQAFNRTSGKAVLPVINGFINA